MIPMDGNTESNKHSVVQQRSSVDTKKNSNWIADARRARTIRKKIADLVPPPINFITLYVFFFQWPT
jgi:hypothetical protein